MSVESESLNIFLHKLGSEFRKINKEVYRHTNQYLSEPIFAIKNSEKQWGSYSSSKKTIYIKEDLLKSFEWGAVVHVLKHEVAHMIVHDIFNMGHLVSHGPQFALACKIVNIEPSCCFSSDFLKGFAGYENHDPIISKVKKIMAKGYDSSITENEAMIFLTKAKELMMQNNIDQEDLKGGKKTYVCRPVGGQHKRFPSWLFDIGNFVKDHYNVKVIRTNVYDSNHNLFYYLEIFGEPSNVDVAEYMFHSIMNQGDILYENFKKSKRLGYQRISKASFMMGLIRGYRTVMSKVVISEDQNKLILANDAILDAKFRSNYKVVQVSRSASRGAGYDSGMQAGKGLNIHSGIKSSTLMLT